MDSMSITSRALAGALSKIVNKKLRESNRDVQINLKELAATSEGYKVKIHVNTVITMSYEEFFKILSKGDLL